MANNTIPNAQFLAPPAVTALRQEARTVDSKFSPMTRTISDDMREEREDLREAAEQTLNVIADLDLEGRVKWVSPSWKQVIGTPPGSVEGRLISEIVVDNQHVFHDAIESMKEDDSRSRFVRFAVRMGPNSTLKSAPERQQSVSESKTDDGGAAQNAEIQPGQAEDDQRDILSMEAQGIMVFDRLADDASHVRAISGLVTEALTDNKLNLDNVDAPTLHPSKRSDNRFASPPRGIPRYWSGGTSKLLDNAS